MVIVDHAFRLVGPSVRHAWPPGSIAAPNVDRPPAAPPTAIATGADPNLIFEKLPTRDYQLHLWANSLRGYSKIMERNGEMIPECTSDVEAASRNQTNPLDNKPLIVLSTSFSVEPYAELQRKLLSLSLNSKHTVAENTAHQIMVDRPDVVIRAIHEVVDAAQNHTKLRN
jgi:hypothetical protein